VDNARIAAVFEELADLLELGGDNPFKTRAYRAFAEAARARGEPLTAIAARGELEAMNGVGKAIAQKVVEIAATGTCPALERARAAVPSTLRDVLRVPGLGVKTVRLLWKEAGVTTLGELANACEEDRIAKVSSFGEKKQARTLAAVRAMLRRGTGFLLGSALDTANVIRERLEDAGAREVAVVGDARRGRELVPELVMLARGIGAEQAAALLTGVEALGGGPATQHDGEVLVTVHGALRTRVRVVSDADWVHALITGTGDAAHVRWLTARAEGDLRAACARAGAMDEASVYRALGLPFVPPELRAGAVESVPDDLIKASEVRGVFHVHTNWSDGAASILEMARAAVSGGLRFLGISDHSQASSYANGLDAARLAEQKAAIAIARREVPECTIFHGMEVDILPDGALDLDDEALAALDFVIASVHSRMGMGHAEMTKRIVRAVSHPLVTILGHPTGRLLLGRKGYSFDVEEVARAAAANDTYLEINANAQRLDLDEAMVRRAARRGARFAIDPDAHATRGLGDTALGVMMARRAGLTREQLLNARDRDEMAQVLAARKKAACERLAKSM
jgi:DNA polymerase (family 10)